MAQNYRGVVGNAADAPTKPIRPGTHHPNPQHIADFMAKIATLDELYIMVQTQRGEGIGVTGKCPFPQAYDDEGEPVITVHPLILTPKSRIQACAAAARAFAAAHDGAKPPVRQRKSHIAKLRVGDSKDIEQSPLALAVLAAKGRIAILSEAEYKREEGWLRKHHAEADKLYGETPE